MYLRSISLEEIIQIWIISSKDISRQYLCKVYCRELGQYLMLFDALEKIVTNGLQYANTNEDEKFICWINVHTLIEKQSNEDGNTPIHLKNNAPHIKVHLIFWFLIMISTYVFITNCGLNGYVYILEIALDILNKLIHDSQNICGCLTLNAMHIKLASLIICLIDDNLTNMSSTPPSEGKKTILYIAHLIILCTLNRNFHLLEI